MKQITLTHLDSEPKNGERVRGFSIRLISTADIMPGEFDSTIRLLKTLLPDVKVTTAHVTDRITHDFIITPLGKEDLAT